MKTTNKYLIVYETQFFHYYVNYIYAESKKEAIKKFYENDEIGNRIIAIRKLPRCDIYLY